ncbi:DNA-binding transcriptional regulator, LysR family [Cognatiyoonia sediminum]|uniref:DNA-binding transcriptional regulator, LysR family n=1 Tax=Cognatiyoonia sediminum TaxID=1508389 RepID=A0A1M5NE34_9RHOB|nr:LysR family transcriptional regulator [Cognatiyoonia sediminum]SHG87834.1 DNA-binding transcriptional regulator, LysR family [Cognatiyoonia sediminum]
MDWRAPKFDWNQARAFWATAETGSLSEAARSLGLTQPTLGRQVSALEDDLDVVLFERIGKRLVLTPTGQDLLTHMRRMGDAAQQVELSASGRNKEVAGDVCVSVTDIFAQLVMPAIVAELRLRAPQVRILVQASNSLSDLQRRQADIAIRHVPPTQPELITRKVRDGQGKLYASQRYIAEKGPFWTLDDLGRADFIGSGNEEEMLSALKAMGVPVTSDNICVISDSGIGGWEMARASLGIMPMLEELAVAWPEMQIIVPDAPVYPVPYYLTTHRELHSSRRIRLVFDLLAELLSQPDLPIFKSRMR